MTIRSARFSEETATDRISGVELGHLSIELGHLYREDFEAGPDRLRELFAAVAPWAETAARVCTSAIQPRTARISTCFLIDDYFAELPSPGKIMPLLQSAAAEHGVQIDYLARESACADTDGIPLTSLVLGQVVEDPPRGSNGSRPPARESGWLSNGQRSPHTGGSEAMKKREAWRPARQNGAVRHSVFVDVELWDDDNDLRTWSCPFLASVWQLQRLGLLRHMGAPAGSPAPLPDPLPGSWFELPPIIKLNPKAAPFRAYRTFSILDGRFLEIEHAVRMILSQVAIDNGVSEFVVQQADKEGIYLPAEAVHRISYTFLAADRTPCGSRERSPAASTIVANAT